MVSRNCSCKLLRAVLAEISAVRSVAESDRVLGSAATISNSDVPSPPATAAADTAPCADSADDSAAKNSRSEASIDSRGFAIMNTSGVSREDGTASGKPISRPLVWQAAFARRGTYPKASIIIRAVGVERSSVALVPSPTQPSPEFQDSLPGAAAEASPIHQPAVRFRERSA